VALINNDVYLEPDWHAEARKALLSRPRLGSCATCLLRETQPELVDSAGIVWTRPGWAENYLSGRTAPPADEPDREIFGSCAAAALYRAEVFNEIGLFDESLFAYQEDVDLALRAQAAGWRCVFAPAARGLHTGHGSNRSFPVNGTWADYYNARNRLAVLVASLPGSEWQAHWRTILADEAAAVLSGIKEQRAAATLAGFARGLLRLPGLVLRRYRNSERLK
jgi:GT2 family glycosyltransferase